MSRLESLREALAQSPDKVALLLLYAHACLDEIHLEDAHETFSRILELDPEHIDAQLGLARALVLQGDTSAAAVRVERILQRRPQNVAAHLLLSRIHLAEENRAKALLHYSRALELDASASDPALEADLGRIVKPQGKDRIVSPLDLLPVTQCPRVVQPELPPR